MPIYNTVRFLRLEAQLLIDDQALAAFCERNHIRRLAFFGSVLGPTFDRTATSLFSSNSNPAMFRTSLWPDSKMNSRE